MTEVPPYMNASGKIKDILEAIKKASVPSKFTADYLGTVLGFKSSSDRAFIPLLKRLGFINQNNEPTELYRKFRDEKLSRNVMGQAIKDAYQEVYNSNEFAHRMTKVDFTNIIKRITGFGDDDRRITAIVGTFYALKDFAEFEIVEEDDEPELHEEKPPEHEQTVPFEPKHRSRGVELGISYTINLNLPATTDIEVFNAIFKSLKENIISKD